MKPKPIVSGLVGLLITALTWEPAAAWSHADRWGGSTSHDAGSGSTTRTTGWGGSETHTYGQGTTATGRYGDTATHTEGSGSTSFSNPYGGSATHVARGGYDRDQRVRRHGDALHRVGTDVVHQPVRRQRDALLRLRHHLHERLGRDGLP